MMMITDAGTLVRTHVAEVSQVGRNTQGVTLIRTAEDENVVGLQRIDEVEEAEIVEGEAEEADAETINAEVSEASEEQASDASDSESDSEQDTE